MGSAASTKLKCPKDYEQEKFAKILKLYDHLDSNGDQVIETLELKDIAKLHIKNKFIYMVYKWLHINNIIEQIL